MARILLLAWLLVAAGAAFAQARVNLSDFYGRFGADLPETEEKESQILPWSVRCEPGKCTLTTHRETIVARPEPVDAAVFARAVAGLNYTKQRRDETRRRLPWMAPLLDSGANLRSCIQLKAHPGDPPGLNLVCTLDRNPGPRPAVLVMEADVGASLGICGRIFCEYSFAPLTKDFVNVARSPRDWRRPSGPNCNLEIPPKNAGDGRGQGRLGDFKVYPRLPDMGPAYTGCQLQWLVDGDKPLLFLVVFVRDGLAVRYWFPEQFGNTSFCHDEKGDLIEGRGGCTPRQHLLAKSWPAGCFEAARRGAWEPRCREE